MMSLAGAFLSQLDDLVQQRLRACLSHDEAVMERRAQIIAIRALGRHYADVTLAQAGRKGQSRHLVRQGQKRIAAAIKVAAHLIPAGLK